MTENKFVNLHTHSFYSILEAPVSPQKLCEKAKSLGCDALALTDTGVGYGLLNFYESAQKIGIKPILGAEIFVAKDSRFEHRAGIDGKEGSLVLLAQTQAGWENLLKILSKSHLEGFYYKPRADWELLADCSKDLVVLSGGTGGLIGKTYTEQGSEAAIFAWQKVQEIFGKDKAFVELVARDYEEQKILNTFNLELAEITDSQLVATADARYLEAADESVADIFHCIGKNQLVTDEYRVRFAEANWFKSWPEICRDLSYVPEELLESARQNTLSITESIDLTLEFNRNLLPEFPLEAGETQISQLTKNCLIGWKSRNIESMDAEAQKTYKVRLDYELSIITKMGFSAYFLIVEDFIKFARQNGIAVGPGRGSAAGSLVSYLLAITNVDPIEYDLLFERFLNPERISMPDIDIDFSDERRDEVLQYVIEKYGAEKVSKVCTFGTLATKAALKDVGRAQGVPFAEMNAMTKLLPGTPGFKLKDAEKVPDFKALLQRKPNLRKVFDVAKRLEGSVRHVSVHACAVIIGAKDLTSFTPIQWAPGADAIKITQFPYEQLESLGLLKMDFLGLRNLSILEKALGNIQQTTGEEINLDSIPLDCKKTFSLFAQGDTTGIFQFESAGMRRYLKELKPTEFEDLVAMNALYRPGPMEYIPQYIRGKHTPKTVEYVHKDLKSILQKTYGIAVYQEQVLRIAQEFAGFSLGEADILRKAIGKKIGSILAEQRDKFIKGAIDKGYDKKLATNIFDDIVVPFSGYGFNRSHAVCYARIAYETAYLRANFPVEFMAAMMTIDRNNTDRIVLAINECAAMGIEVLPPSVNQSGSHFTVVSTQQSSISDKELSKKVLHNKSIRFGLTAIKGLGEDTVSMLITERNTNGAFESLQDFAKRVPTKVMNKKSLEALAFSGALDAFGNRQAVVDSLDELSKFARDYQEKKEAGQMGLFGGADATAIEFALKDTVATKEDILRWERESLGMYVTDHPLKGLDKYFEKYGSLIGRLTGAEDGGRKRTLHGLITKVRRIVTKRGKNMAILELEDTSGKIECAVFPNIYNSIPQTAFVQDAFVRVRGKIEEREDLLNCIVDEIKVGKLADVQGSKLFDKVSEPALKDEETEIEPLKIIVPTATTKEKISALKELLKTYKSQIPSDRKVVVVVGGQSVEVPFRIKNSASLEPEIAKIL